MPEPTEPSAPDRMPYLIEPPVTLVCPSHLKTRLMWRLSNWASDWTGKLHPGITVNVARRDRDDHDAMPGLAYVTIPLRVFLRYGDPPFTGGGAIIAWWCAPRAYVIADVDLDGSTSMTGPGAS